MIAQRLTPYAELRAGDGFNPNGRESFNGRIVATVSAPYTLCGVSVVAVECTDGYCVEVLAQAPAKPQPRR